MTGQRQGRHKIMSDIEKVYKIIDDLIQRCIENSRDPDNPEKLYFATSQMMILQELRGQIEEDVSE
jgi:hypothetical protein